MKVTISYPDFSEKVISFGNLVKNTKYTVLYFYPKDNTPGCTLEAQDFSRMKKEFDALNAQIVGVSKDIHKTHCKFMEKQSIPYALISDSDFALHRDERFLTVGEKSMFGKKYMGTIRSTFVLDSEGSVIKEWRKVKVAGHAKEVLDYITGL